MKHSIPAQCYQKKCGLPYGTGWQGTGTLCWRIRSVPLFQTKGIRGSVRILTLIFSVDTLPGHAGMEAIGPAFPWFLRNHTDG